MILFQSSQLQWEAQNCGFGAVALPIAGGFCNHAFFFFPLKSIRLVSLVTWLSFGLILKFFVTLIFYFMIFSFDPHSN